MLSSILLVLGIAVLGMAFRTFDRPVAQRLSVLCVLVVSFLIGYLPSGSWLAGLMLMNESMSPGTHFGTYRKSWGQFDGLIVLIALALGGAALVTGLIIGRMVRETATSQG